VPASPGYMLFSRFTRSGESAEVPQPRQSELFDLSLENFFEVLIAQEVTISWSSKLLISFDVDDMVALERVEHCRRATTAR